MLIKNYLHICQEEIKKGLPPEVPGHEMGPAAGKVITQKIDPELERKPAHETEDASHPTLFFLIFPPRSPKPDF